MLRSFLSVLRTVLSLTISTRVLALVIRTWVMMGLISPIVVEGASMEPTLHQGDRLWIDRTAYQWVLPQRWEVVVISAPYDATDLCVKRVVALPGEEITIRRGEIWINGVKEAGPTWLPPALARTWTGGGGTMEPVHLESDQYFLLGDNGPVSLDCRIWGAVPGRSIVGRPLGVR